MAEGGRAAVGGMYYEVALGFLFKRRPFKERAGARSVKIHLEAKFIYDNLHCPRWLVNGSDLVLCGGQPDCGARRGGGVMD